MSEVDELCESQIIFHLSIHDEWYQLSSFGTLTHGCTTFLPPQISLPPCLPLHSHPFLDPLILPYEWRTAHFKKAESAMGLESHNSE